MEKRFAKTAGLALAVLTLALLLSVFFDPHWDDIRRVYLCGAATVTGIICCCLSLYALLGKGEKDADASAAAKEA